MMKLFFFIITAIAIIPLNFLHGNELIEVDNNFSHINFTGKLEYLEDREGVLNIEQVAEPGRIWIKNNRDYINFGFTSSAFWFRFSLDNKKGFEQKLFLEIDLPTLDYVDFYIPDDRGGYISRKTGDRRSFKTREINDRNFVFLINIKPGNSTCYLRIKSTSTFNIFTRLMTDIAYIDRRNSVIPPLFIFFGTLLIIALYNFIIFITTREFTYLFFVGFILSFFLMDFTVRGFSFQYLWPESTWWNSNSIPFFIGLTVLFSGLFFNSYLELKTRYPDFYKINGMIVVIPGAAFSLLSLLLPFEVVIQKVFVVVILSAFASTILIIYAMIKRDRDAIYLLFGFIYLMLLLPVSILTIFGVIPLNTFTKWGPDIGMGWLMIFFSIAIGGKINRLNRELKSSNDMLNHKIIELKNMQEKLISKEKLVIAGELSAGLAHEIGNQLGAIEYLEVIKDRFDEKDMEYIGYIFNSRDRIKTLIRELRTLTKSEEIDYKLAPFNLKKLVDEAISIAKLSQDINKIKIITGNDSDIEIIINKDKIIQVFLNIIRNAADAIGRKDDGRILITCRYDDNFAYVKISDNGNGIDEEEMNLIWEPFYTTKGDEGTGVGLHISRDIIEKHGGKIDCFSEAGKGAVFTVALPLKEPGAL